MTHIQPGPTTTYDGTELYEDGTPSGWILFSGTMLILVGMFQGFEGFVALLNQHYYSVTHNGLVIKVDYTAWGWTHLVIGLIALATGLGVMAKKTWGRIVGFGLAILSALANMAFMKADPIWSCIVIALDVIIIWSLAVHWHDADVDA
jgi:hypothetical protein